MPECIEFPDGLKGVIIQEFYKRAMGRISLRRLFQEFLCFYFNDKIEHVLQLPYASIVFHDLFWIEGYKLTFLLDLRDHLPVRHNPFGCAVFVNTIETLQEGSSHFGVFFTFILPVCGGVSHSSAGRSHQKHMQQKHWNNSL